MSDPNPIQPARKQHLSRRQQALLILAAVTTVGAVGVVTPAIGAAAYADAPSSSRELQTDQTIDDSDWDDSDSDWDDSDWDDPFEGMTDDEIDALSDDEFYDLLDAEFEDFDDSDWDDADYEDSDWDDPFEGMTNAEIDALSDDEFYDILDDDADWDDSDWDDTDYEDSDWDDPFEGMTNAEIDALSDDEFYDILDEAGYDGWDDSEWDDEDWDDWDEEVAATFEVVDGELASSGASPEELAQANAIWERFIQLIPASERGMVNSFELLSEFGGAFVYADETDPTKWILGVDSDISGTELDFILIHEFGHLLTLKASEIPTTGNGGSCSTYDPGEGCALSSSTLAKFVAAFWPQSLQDELERLNDAGDWSALDDYYSQNSDSFVSDYALTNPVEDLAETFAEFILEAQPTGNTIADQKVQMLWADPAMVALRTEIRSRM